MTFATRLSFWTPFTSTTLPPVVEMFRSCLIVPSPRATLPVDLSALPRYRAAFSTCSGVPMMGSSAISTRGTPSLSKAKNLERASSPRIRAASSSSVTVCTPTSSPSTDSSPPRAMTAVRWNPEVLEPSMTIFLIT